MYNLKPHGAQMLINVCICCFCKHMTFPVPVVSALMRLIQYSMCGQCTCIFLLQTNSTENTLYSNPWQLRNTHNFFVATSSRNTKTQTNADGLKINK